MYRDRVGCTLELLVFFGFNITFFHIPKVVNEARDFILQLGERKEIHASITVAHVFSPVSIFATLVTADLFVANAFNYDFWALLHSEMEEYICDMEASSTASLHWVIPGRRDHKLHVGYRPQRKLLYIECFDPFTKFAPRTCQKLNL